MAAQVLRIRALDFGQQQANAIQATIARWTGWLAGANVRRVRFISRAVPMDLAEPVHRAREAEANAVAHRDVIRQYTGFLSRTAASNLFSNEHYVVLWSEDMEAAAVAQSLRDMGLPAHKVPGLPPLIDSACRDAWRTLEATGNGRAPDNAYWSILTSYALSGNWGWAALARLLYMGYPVTVVMDMLNMSQDVAMRRLVLAQNDLSASLQQTGKRDVELTRRVAALQQAVQAVHNGQTLHRVVTAVLYPGRTQEELAERTEAIQSLMAPYMSLNTMRPLSEVFQTLFTADENGPLDDVVTNRMRHNTVSYGAATMMGVLGARRRGDTEGVLWGLTDDGAPLFWDGFGPDLDAPNHGVILGRTGSGKTFGAHMLLMREALLRGTQVIELEPMGHSRTFAAALGDIASYNPLDFSTLRINPLDIVYEEPATQIAHVSTQITLLLHRPLANMERAALDAACRRVYAGVPVDKGPAYWPTLEKLVIALRAEGQHAQQLAEELNGLYVEGSLGEVFNAPTNLDLGLTHDVVTFDFSRIAAEYQTLLYAQVLSALRRECLKRRRERRRIIFVDEFRIMSGEPLLAEIVAEMYKTFRTAGTGVWVAEQNLFTLLGLDDTGLGSGDLDLASGRYIFENTRWYVLLAQQSKAVDAIRRAFPDMTDAQAQILQAVDLKTDRGHGVVRYPDGFYSIRFIPTPMELKLLSGT